ncbi:MAG: hypothetical protein ACKVXR_09640 [Planctomycetota bacterium]
MNLGLALLALRRALAPLVLAAWAVVLLVALRVDWAGGSATLEATAGSADAGALARGWAREGTWILVALAIAPLLVSRAARIVPAWRAGEGDWIGSRAVGRLSAVASTLLGTWAAAAILLLVSFASIELRAGDALPSFTPAGSIALPAARWIETRAPLVVTVEDPGEDFPSGSRARVDLAFGSGSGSASEVVMRASRGTERRSAAFHLSSRGTVEVELPPGRGNLAIEIACPRAGTRAYTVSDEVEIWVPCESDRAAGTRILERLLAASLAWIALAVGLAAWMSAPSAALLVLAAWMAAWLGDATPSWLPGGDLWAALDTVGSGRVPATPDPRSHAVALAIAALGVLLGVLGTKRWRAPR